MDMKMIINKSEIRSYDGICRLLSEIEFPDATKTVYFGVSEEYSDGLCDENADAFLAAALLYCMRKGIDIECRAPVSRPMLYWLKERLIRYLTTKDMSACAGREELIRSNLWLQTWMLRKDLGRPICSI